MGNYASFAKTVSSLTFKRATKPLREYNLGSRVDRVLTRDKPVPAPHHPNTEVKYPEDVSVQMKKELFESDPALLKRLEEVYVTSEEIQKDTLASSRPLPTVREHFGEFKYGYYEPKNIPYGKATLKLVLEFITKHHEDPEVWNAQRISEEYKVEKIRIDYILKYFDTYTLVLPASKSDKSIPYNKRMTRILGASSVVQIPSGEEKKSTKAVHV